MNPVYLSRFSEAILQAALAARAVDPPPPGDAGRPENCEGMSNGDGGIPASLLPTPATSPKAS